MLIASHGWERVQATYSLWCLESRVALGRLISWEPELYARGYIAYTYRVVLITGLAGSCVAIAVGDELQ
jgi:hypothetical protein